MEICVHSPICKTNMKNTHSNKKNRACQKSDSLGKDTFLYRAYKKHRGLLLFVTTVVSMLVGILCFLLFHNGLVAICISLAVLFSVGCCTVCVENQAKERSMKRLDEALKNLDKNKITEPPSDNPCESCHGVMFCLRCGSGNTDCDNKGNCVCYKCHFCWICEDFLP